MKLDNKRTILTGFAFLSICAFWQMYNSIVPLILTNTFHLNETYSGAIMAADNILALFLLPLFGSISDRTNTKIGKRMPFILFGTGLAIILMNILPIIDNSYAAAPGTFKTVSFVVVLGLLLVAMGTYRSPAVALMPDITPKPLRSKGNAIINLMGALGGVIYLGVAAVMYPNSKVAGLAHVNYQPLFIVVASIMFVSIAILFLTIKEPKLLEEQRRLEAEHPEWNLAEDDGSGHESLPKNVKKSLGFLLTSIALWFIGYNAVETWFTTYVSQVMGQALGGASTCLLIATDIPHEISRYDGRYDLRRHGEGVIVAGELADIRAFAHLNDHRQGVDIDGRPCKADERKDDEHDDIDAAVGRCQEVAEAEAERQQDDARHDGALSAEFRG